MISITELNLPKSIKVRIVNVLEGFAILSVEHLIQYTEAELLRLNNFGACSLAALKKALTEMGLELKGSGWHIIIPFEEAAIHLNQCLNGCRFHARASYCASIKHEPKRYIISDRKENE